MKIFRSIRRDVTYIRHGDWWFTGLRRMFVKASRLFYKRGIFKTQLSIDLRCDGVYCLNAEYRWDLDPKINPQADKIICKGGAHIAIVTATSMTDTPFDRYQTRRQAYEFRKPINQKICSQILDLLDNTYTKTLWSIDMSYSEAKNEDELIWSFSDKNAATMMKLTLL